MLRVRQTDSPSRAAAAQAVAPQATMGTVTARRTRLLRHKDVRTTMVYTHVLNKIGHGEWTPMDRL